jgi:hypothetical protein
VTLAFYGACDQSLSEILIFASCKCLNSSILLPRHCHVTHTLYSPRGQKTDSKAAAGRDGTSSGSGSGSVAARKTYSSVISAFTGDISGPMPSAKAAAHSTAVVAQQQQQQHSNSTSGGAKTAVPVTGGTTTAASLALLQRPAAMGDSTASTAANYTAPATTSALVNTGASIEAVEADVLSTTGGAVPKEMARAPPAQLKQVGASPVGFNGSNFMGVSVSSSSVQQRATQPIPRGIRTAAGSGSGGNTCQSDSSLVESNAPSAGCSVKQATAAAAVAGQLCNTSKTVARLTDLIAATSSSSSNNNSTNTLKLTAAASAGATSTSAAAAAAAAPVALPLQQHERDAFLHTDSESEDIIEVIPDAEEVPLLDDEPATAAAAAAGHTAEPAAAAAANNNTATAAAAPGAVADESDDPGQDSPSALVKLMLAKYVYTVQLFCTCARCAMLRVPAQAHAAEAQLCSTAVQCKL